MRRRLTQLLSSGERPLQGRLAVLVASAVAAAVALTGVAAYLITNVTVFNQLDGELVDVAAVTANWVAVDIEGMGGLDANALKAANVTVMLVRADNRVSRLPGERVTLEAGYQELSVARRQQGSSARTGYASNGAPYRIVAVPFKYLLDQPLGVKVLGPLHGTLFLSLAVTTLAALGRGLLRPGLAMMLIVGAFLPLGAFLADYKLRQAYPELQA